MIERGKSQTISHCLLIFKTPVLRSVVGFFFFKEGRVVFPERELVHVEYCALDLNGSDRREEGWVVR